MRSALRVDRMSAALLGVVLTVGIVGCAPEPDADESRTSTKDVSTPKIQTSADPTTVSPPPEEPSASQITIPECAEILPIESVRSVLENSNAELFPTASDRADFLASEPFGPSAMEAFEGAKQLTHCTWAYPQSDGFADVVFAELSPDARLVFTAALDDSVFVKSQVGTATVYEDSSVERRMLPVRHGFVGNIWVGTTGPISGYLFEPALSRIATLNPGESDRQN